MLGTPLHFWVIFFATVAVALAVDLGVFHRKSHTVHLKEALLESLGWITVSLIFNAWVYYSQGHQAGLEFLTGYLVEKSLSLDNIFVFLIIFQSFQIPAKSQHRVLFYGVIGALVMRALFVIAGVELLQYFHSVIYVFGAILLFTALRMVLPSGRTTKPNQNWLVRLTRRFMPYSDDPTASGFFLKREGRWNATPLFMALVAVEAMDIVFAVDSVPAVLAITRNTFIVYSSNAFAILGLRALYFALAGLLPRFRFLHQGLAAILFFVGGKMVLSEWVTVSAPWSLATIAVILAATIAASLLFPAPASATETK
jgi:TerC family integral membrane protein